jgi:hypothetical protein
VSDAIPPRAEQLPRSAAAERMRRHRERRREGLRCLTIELRLHCQPLLKVALEVIWFSGALSDRAEFAPFSFAPRPTAPGSGASNERRPVVRCDAAKRARHDRRQSGGGQMTLIPLHHQTKGRGAVSAAPVAKSLCRRDESSNVLPSHTSR